MSQVEVALRGWARWGALIAVVLLMCGIEAAVGAARASSTTVTTHQTKRGMDLAAGNGRTLYLFTADKAGRSDCTGSCASAWLPLLTTGRPVAAKGSGLNAKLLGSIRRANHRLQVTYNGHPLYEFTGDSAPGQITGEGANAFGGHWYIVNQAGTAVQLKTGKPVCHSICQGY